MPPKFTSVGDGLRAAEVDRARRHLFLCLGPDCADLREGEATWQHLKALCRTMNLPVMRTKAGCLRVCVGGPWLLIYPDGVWYGEVTPARCERILQEHVAQDRPIAEWVQKTHPLCGGAAPAGDR